MTEEEILEAELATKQKEITELEATLANFEAILLNLEKELETLEELLAQRIEAPVIPEEPIVLAEPEPVKEIILSLDWLKKNWLWVGIGLVSLSLIVTIAKN